MTCPVYLSLARQSASASISSTPGRAIAEPPKVINLMEALKRSLAQDAEPEPKKAARATHMGKGCSRPPTTGALLPGGRKKTDAVSAEPTHSGAPKRTR